VFNFFDGPPLVRPAVTEADAERITAELFGISGTARELGSQQDRNFRIDSVDEAGETHSFLLKVDNAAFSEAELSAQDAAMEHLADRGLRIPAPIVGLDGQTRQRWTDAADAAASVGLPVRMFSFLPGGSLVDEGHLDASVIGELGRISATVAGGLADFSGAGLDRQLQWDMRNAEAVVEELIDRMPDPVRRDQVRQKSEAAANRLNAVAATLRVQPIHGDVTDDNVVCSRGESGRRFPDGVIDFGDLGYGWLVAELAVTMSSILHHVPEHPAAVFEAVRRFDEVVRLTDDEISAIWPLIVLRGAVLVVSGENQTQLEAGNVYAEERMQSEWDVFETAQRIGFDEAEVKIRQLLGRDALSSADSSGVGSAAEWVAEAPMIAAIAAGDYVVLDFSVTSPLLNEGRWLQPGAEWAAAAEALGHTAVAIAPYGQHRLTRSRPHHASEPETFAAIAELYLGASTRVHAPLPAVVVRASGDELVLSIEAVGNAVAGAARAAGDAAVGSDAWELALTGLTATVAAGTQVAAGQLIGTVNPVAEYDVATDRSIGRLRVQRRRSGATPPFFATPSWSEVWRVLAPDPALLLGYPPLPATDPAEKETARRERVFAAAQERYYAEPPQIERGWQQFLVATDGRCHLDMVNNVTGIGHSHPRLNQAVFEQMQLLNTNSRFLYRALADLSERLVELAPDPSLDTVLLVNSGSEAVDLGLRLAQMHTGRRTVVALREAYHGWTMASDAVTTSAYDNPYALANRPDWVEVAEAPNTYRGQYRGAAAGAEYLADFVEQMDAVAGTAGRGSAAQGEAQGEALADALGEALADALADALGEDGRGIAAFICEPILGNAGGVVLPDGYLAGVYADIRARGGLCIADEVQVGYGRLGEYFWGVQQQGVVPDIITVAKAMGNAFPLGAVITRREIAESLAREGNFFSSAGGSPVSSVAGLAVLDVMRDEGLQENARVVGAHLVDRLTELAEKHALIGAVHGLGLYLGIELVRDRVTLEPAAAETAAICERMRELGVIVQPTSERQNVLKVKPPLCLTIESADFFIDMLDEVLTRGW
jgi:4-aminobutyrate aminotransferase-like enzyme/Ser/Thr protein kinase RdoA (MazF antagonist)